MIVTALVKFEEGFMSSPRRGLSRFAVETKTHLYAFRPIWRLHERRNVAQSYDVSDMTKRALR